MRLVILESPFKGNVARNLRYARAAVRDCALRGESALASHTIWTQEGVLDDDKQEERDLGIECGLSWARVADAAVFYIDLGWSGGMNAALARHGAEGRSVEIRTLGGEW